MEQYTMMEIEEDMARRIAYQKSVMKGAPKSCTNSVNRRLGFLPKEWLVVADEWCADHKLDLIHGAMALFYLQGRYKTEFSTVELRVILDDAYEMSKGVKWYQ